MFKPSPVCAAIAVLLAASLVHAAPEPSQDVAARIDQPATYKADAPGVTVIVVKDGKTLLRKAYGLADVEHKLPLAADTPMRLRRAIPDDRHRVQGHRRPAAAPLV
jgi:D-alanyl-D-alanine carboxypeptidase